MTDHHTHTWTPADDTGFACAHCEATTPVCGTCGDRPLEDAIAICRPCLTAERRILTTTATLVDQLPGNAREILGIKAIRYDHTPTGGGDGLPFGIGSDDDDPVELAAIAATRGTVIDLLRQPDNVLDVLHGWADAWTDAQQLPPWSGSVFDWLAGTLTWAAANPDASEWHTYREEARLVRSRIRTLAGLAPEREPAPCVHCGGKVVRDWTDPDGHPHDRGLSDVLRCTGCGTTWGDRHRFDYLNLTTLRALPETHPDALVTVEDARLAVPTARRNTINQRLKRDRDRAAAGAPRRIPERGEDVRGRPVYRLGDLLGSEAVSVEGSGA
ncbi:hypothetical protein [Ruania rhizosphaerae]|uniref:hypothetical protein n=1 Tax=Ruania rhizosphaerae TaxID=1840413 RepID=UPI00135CC97E|nr:hypothetical protein [Ruania rhizosphaerae]